MVELHRLTDYIADMGHSCSSRQNRWRGRKLLDVSKLRLHRRHSLTGLPEGIQRAYEYQWYGAMVANS